MPVLVINCGSSSLKVSVVDPATGLHSAELAAERLGSAQATVAIQGGTPRPSPPSHADAMERFLPELLAELPVQSTIDCVGHR